MENEENRFVALFERSKDDRLSQMIVGSEIREVIQAYRAALSEIASLRSKRGEDARLRDALSVIAAWSDATFPASGHFWDEEKTRPMRYRAAFGSNGERDYMRGIAIAALAASPEAEPRCKRCRKIEKDHHNGLCFGTDICPGNERFEAESVGDDLGSKEGAKK